MARRKAFGRKKFKGNQHTNRKEQTEASSEKKLILETPTSSSKRKLSGIPHYEYLNTNGAGNIIIDISILSDLLKQSAKCKNCNKDGTMTAEIEGTQHKGLAVSIAFRCTACKNSAASMSSKISRNQYDINIRLVYGMRCIGKGNKSAEVFCAMMNLPPPPQRFSSFHERIFDSLDSISKSSMKAATEETVMLAGGNRDIAAAFDGSWQKRGHTSLNGVAVCTSLETGKVMDFECLTKNCFKCRNSPSEEHICDKNYVGTSGGMEAAGVMQIFQRSEAERQVRYLDYLGDGDSKAYDQVVASQVYGTDTTIEKLECVGHVQKRMGTRLRKLRQDLKKTKLSDGKSISGRGRLTDREVNLLQAYYGLAIRRNANKSVQEMSKAVWAIYFHKLSTDVNPQHGLCPTDDDTWCKFNKPRNCKYTHTNSLPEPVLLAMKPIFRALSDPKLLSKCSHGKTQNPNESFNRCIWDRLPKTSFHGIKSFKIGVMDAVLCFNDGSQKRLEVLRNLGIEPGYYMSQALKKLDETRICEANRATKQASKEARKANKNKKRKFELEECLNISEYGSGAF